MFLKGVIKLLKCVLHTLEKTVNSDENNCIMYVLIEQMEIKFILRKNIRKEKQYKCNDQNTVNNST
jgi:ribosomal protein S17